MSLRFQIRNYLTTTTYGSRGTAHANFANFDWNRRLSWKRYETGPCLLWNVNRSHRWRIDTCQFWWLWVTH